MNRTWSNYQKTNIKTKILLKHRKKKILAAFEKHSWHEESNAREKVGSGNRMKSVGNRNIWLNIKGI